MNSATETFRQTIFNNAVNGNAAVQYTMAWAYRYGYFGLQPNSKESLHWLRTAAASKHPEAEQELRSLTSQKVAALYPRFTHACL
jgi:TPR repeat protein